MSPQLRIIHVITSLRTGGAERLLTQLLPALAGMGAEVHLALFDGTDTPFLHTLKDSGITIHILGQGYRSMYSPAHIMRLRQLFRQGFDIIHTHNTTPQLFTAIAGHPAGSKLVTTEHNTTNRRRTHSWLRSADRWMYRHYDHIICCSEAVETSLQSYLGPGFHITTIPNGIDLTPYTATHSAPDTPTIVMVAAFRQQKDHITPLRALARLPKPIRLIYAGDGPTRPAAEDEAKRLGVADRVTFLGNVSDIPHLYSTASIALLSTRHEGLSLSVIEAMASGTPLIASDVPGVREMTGDGALLFPFGDDSALASLITSLLDNPSDAKALAARARNIAARYDIRHTAAAHMDIYRNK